MSDIRNMTSLVRIDSHYRRSIKLDTDFGNPHGLGAYVCNRSARAVVETFARQISEGNQYAFTITGPYGGGKSSLALVLASAIQSNDELRKRALHRLDKETRKLLQHAFPYEYGRLVIPVSGNKSNAVKMIGARLNEINGKKVIEPAIASGHDLIESLCKLSKSKKHDGVVLIIDELGKFLEAASQGDGDINFFQELAEASARSEGRLIVIGVLHQAFQQYVSRLGGGFRTEWAKVQGRFVDIPLIAGADEVVSLIGKAIDTKIEHPWSISHSKTVAESLKKNRAGLSDEILGSLEDCWPMHPAMAVLLGPFSRRQFGQNERSVFGFLSTAEPHGFRHYLESTNDPKLTSYKPSNFWDYLKSNLEPAILASTDAHRWAQASDAVARVEAKCDANLIELIKNLAVVDLFKAGSGIEPTETVLQSLYEGRGIESVQQSLSELAELRVAVFRKHRNSWAIFEGSDFDIDDEIQKVLLADERSQTELVRQYIHLHPVVAKRHYYEKGALRWMNVEVCDEILIQKLDVDNSALGTFAVCLFSDDLSYPQSKKLAAKYASESIVPGVCRESNQILEAARELSALMLIQQTNHQLVGDAVARKEVFSRLASIKSTLEQRIRNAIQGAEWCVAGKWTDSNSLSILASTVADSKFDNAPCLNNELLNREILSTNAVKARRELLYRMLRNESEPALGLIGWAAERGLYESVLADSGLHKNLQNGIWGFSRPSIDDPVNCKPLWNHLEATINEDSLVNVQDIYDQCKLPPFGVKSGLLPVFLFAYLLANKNSVAVYKDRMFVSQLSETEIDECLKEPSRFDLRKVIVDETKAIYLHKYAEAIEKLGRPLDEITPLAVARTMVTIAFQLPEWTRRTRSLSDEAISLRDLLLRASDPHELLFVDIPRQFSGKNQTAIAKTAGEALAELVRSYTAMLSQIANKMLGYMEALPIDYGSLQKRAAAIDGISGDFRFNAFASRIKDYDGTLERLESILSLAANKPPKTWTDSDIDSALLELTGWATRFRQVEAHAAVQGREPNREAFAVVIGSAGTSKSLIKSFDISVQDKSKAAHVAKKILEMCKKEAADDKIIWAALALAGVTVSEVDNG
ncbi:MAG: ATP-binding protein [Fluviibacter phosphoraccumulans]